MPINISKELFSNFMNVLKPPMCNHAQSNDAPSCLKQSDRNMDVDHQIENVQLQNRLSLHTSNLIKEETEPENIEEKNTTNNIKEGNNGNVNIEESMSINNNLSLKNDLYLNNLSYKEDLTQEDYEYISAKSISDLSQSLKENFNEKCIEVFDDKDKNILFKELEEGTFCSSQEICTLLNKLASSLCTKEQIEQLARCVYKCKIHINVDVNDNKISFSGMNKKTAAIADNIAFDEIQSLLKYKEKDKKDKIYEAFSISKALKECRNPSNIRLEERLKKGSIGSNAISGIRRTIFQGIRYENAFNDISSEVISIHDDLHNNTHGSIIIKNLNNNGNKYVIISLQNDDFLIHDLNKLLESIPKISNIVDVALQNFYIGASLSRIKDEEKNAYVMKVIPTSQSFNLLIKRIAIITKDINKDINNVSDAIDHIEEIAIDLYKGVTINKKIIEDISKLNNYVGDKDKESEINKIISDFIQLDYKDDNLLERIKSYIPCMPSISENISQLIETTGNQIKETLLGPQSTEEENQIIHKYDYPFLPCEIMEYVVNNLQEKNLKNSQTIKNVYKEFHNRILYLQKQDNINDRLKQYLVELCAYIAIKKIDKKDMLNILKEMISIKSNQYASYQHSNQSSIIDSIATIHKEKEDVKQLMSKTLMRNYRLSHEDIERLNIEISNCSDLRAFESVFDMHQAFKLCNEGSCAEALEYIQESINAKLSQEVNKNDIDSLKRILNKKLVDSHIPLIFDDKTKKIVKVPIETINAIEHDYIQMAKYLGINIKNDSLSTIQKKVCDRLNNINKKYPRTNYSITRAYDEIDGEYSKGNINQQGIIKDVMDAISKQFSSEVRHIILGDLKQELIDEYNKNREMVSKATKGINIHKEIRQKLEQCFQNFCTATIEEKIQNSTEENKIKGAAFKKWHKPEFKFAFRLPKITAPSIFKATQRLPVLRNIFKYIHESIIGYPILSLALRFMLAAPIMPLTLIIILLSSIRIDMKDKDSENYRINKLAGKSSFTIFNGEFYRRFKEAWNGTMKRDKSNI